jgi:pimeloyl-ACP methyl ester carboxylesterase
MATFVICHGAWSAGWAWKKVRPLLRARGHEVFTPTYTGLGERAHQASPAVDLETHIADVLGVLECEDLRDIVLLGHSYGGMVATGVADRAAARLRQIIYLDAFVPAAGQSLMDLAPQRRAGVAAPAPAGDNLADWQIAPNPPPPDTTAADIAWITPRRRPQPKQTFLQKLELANGEVRLPRSYIYCTRKDEGDVFAQFRRLKNDPKWSYFEIDASHSPNVTAPEALVMLLCKIVG